MMVVLIVAKMEAVNSSFIQHAQTKWTYWRKCPKKNFDTIEKKSRKCRHLFIIELNFSTIDDFLVDGVFKANIEFLSSS